MEKSRKASQGFAIAGTLFAGYQSFEKLFHDECFLGEPCPMFLGYPACYFGFCMFLIISSIHFFYHHHHSSNETANTFLKQTTTTTTKKKDYILLCCSLLGALFACYFVLNEPTAIVSSDHVLYLSTCAWGMFFFVGIALCQANLLLLLRL